MDTKEIKSLIRGLEVKGTYLGSGHAIAGVELILADRDYLHSITKGLYADLAEHFQTTAECIERDIRTYVKVVWEKGNRGRLEEIAGRKQRIDTADTLEFLAMIAWEVENQQEK